MNDFEENGAPNWFSNVGKIIRKAGSLKTTIR